MNNKTGIIRQTYLDKFGVQPGTYKGPLQDSYIKDIKSAIEVRSQVALVAQFGSGKTDLVNQVKQSWTARGETRPLFVDIASPDKARLTITSVLDAMLRRLDPPKKGSSTEAKATNLIAALGRHLRDHSREVCLVIDNAHRCREELFSELRDLREQDFNGIKPLFAVLLVGQEGLEGKLNERKEVGWRTQFLFLNENHGWWTFSERVNYLTSVYGRAITGKARENIAAKTRVPLEIDVCVADAMQRASQSGVKSVIDEEVVPGTIRDRRESLGLSQQDVANEAGISKASVSNAEAGKGNPKYQAIVAKTLDKLQGRKNNKEQAV